MKEATSRGKSCINVGKTLSITIEYFPSLILALIVIPFQIFPIYSMRYCMEWLLVWMSWIRYLSSFNWNFYIGHAVLILSVVPSWRLLRRTNSLWETPCWVAMNFTHLIMDRITSVRCAFSSTPDLMFTRIFGFNSYLHPFSNLWYYFVFGLLNVCMLV